MRNFWVAIISVLMIASFAGTSMATAPVVQDIPDFKLMTGSGTVEDFDLNNYVTDFDNPVTSLDWTINSQTGFLADPASLSGSNDNLLGLAGSSVVDEGVVTLRATDASEEYTEDNSSVKYSSFLVSSPALTQDRALSNPSADVFPHTWVVVGEDALTSADLGTLVTPSSVTDSLEWSVSIADLDGQVQAFGASSATYGDLTASLSAEGELVLAAPAGSYPLTGTMPLSGAYRVGVKAVLPGGVGDPDWDGAEVLVSQSRFPMFTKPGSTTVRTTQDRLDSFDGFENVTPGALIAGQTNMRNENAAGVTENTRWYVAVPGADVSIIAEGDVPKNTGTAWATSGQALKVTVDQGESVFIQSENFTDIQPGEELTFACNMTTDLASTDILPAVVMVMGNFHMPSNYGQITFQQGTNAVVDHNSVPTGGADGWRTMKAHFKADENGASITDSETSETVNFHQAGYQLGFSIGDQGGTVTALTKTVNVYIDNIRVYRDKSVLDQALASTTVEVAKQNAQTELFDGSFETATDVASAGWSVFGTAGGTAVINTTGNSANIYADGDNSLEIALTNPTTRTAALLQFMQADVRLNATTAGGANNTGEGIIGMTCWFKTTAAAPRNCPGILVALADAVFRNVPSQVVGYVGCPLSGEGWKKVEVVSDRLSAANLKAFIIVEAGYDAGASATAGMPQVVASRPYWDPFLLDKAPGRASDAHVFVDDVKFHKVLDDASYFDASVFNY